MVSLLVIGQNVQRQPRVKLAEGHNTVANTSTTWGNVTAGAFFFTAGSGAPQRSVPE